MRIPPLLGQYRKTKPRTERSETNLACRTWRRDEQEKRNLQIATEDTMENNDGVLSLRKDQENKEMT